MNGSRPPGSCKFSSRHGIILNLSSWIYSTIQLIYVSVNLNSPLRHLFHRFGFINRSIPVCLLILGLSSNGFSSNSLSSNVLLSSDALWQTDFGHRETKKTLFFVAGQSQAPGSCEAGRGLLSSHSICVRSLLLLCITSLCAANAQSELDSYHFFLSQKQHI